MTNTDPSLQEALATPYPFQVLADADDGGYVVIFPDLPGCMTQVETLDELPAMVEEARTLWIETAVANGMEIPRPGGASEYSGRFNLRLPKSLHRQLADGAAIDGVSLNQFVVMLLARDMGAIHAAGGDVRRPA